MEKVDVIIPAYRPGEEFAGLLDALCSQSYPIENIIVMNTEEKFWNPKWEDAFPKVKVTHLKKEDFDHGGTRRAAAKLSDADIMVFMTQDAVPADPESDPPAAGESKGRCCLCKTAGQRRLCLSGKIYPYL